MTNIEERGALEELLDITHRLCAPDGCPWDSVQTHDSLKAACIEEACEVLCGINLQKETGNDDNLKEELGDLLFQVVLHSEIASKEGRFTFEDVARNVCEKMIRRHPFVFGDKEATTPEEALALWNEAKREEKYDKQQVEKALPDAFDEAESLIDRARERKGYPVKK